MTRYALQLVSHSKQIGIAVFVAFVTLAAGSVCPCAAQQQESGLVGTWAMSTQMQGGTNVSFYTFAPNGRWSTVSVLQGGPKNGQETQRWGQWQARQVGQDSYAVQVQIQGGAPQRVCAQGQGCTPVQIQLSHMNLQFQVQGNQMRQADGTIFTRAQLPQQLARQLPATLNQAPVPTMVGPNVNGHGGNANGMPNGVGGNCDDLQQQRVCTINNGRMYRDSRGCQVCQGPN